MLDAHTMINNYTTMIKVIVLETTNLTLSRKYRNSSSNNNNISTYLCKIITKCNDDRQRTSSLTLLLQNVLVPVY